MEYFACILGGTALIACGVSLFWVRLPNWHENIATLTDPLAKSAARWAVFQRAVRTINNLLLVIAGGGIVTTTFFAHGRTWMLLWTAVLLTLLLCILFAMIDALTSLAGYRRALPIAARQSLGDLSDGESHAES